MAEASGKGELRDMRKARNRLGTLLQTIKANPLGPGGMEEDEIQSEISEHEANQIASHVLKTKGLYGSAGMLTVEVRNKQFKIPRSSCDLSLYALSRAWVTGEESVKEEPIPYIEMSEPSEIEMLITRDIYRLPSGKNDKIEISRVPSPLKDEFDDKSLFSGADVSLDDYLPKWKKTKRRWIQQSRQVDMKYQRSLEVLYGIFQLSQQAQSAYAGQM